MRKERLINLPKGEYLYQSIFDEQELYSVDESTVEHINRLVMKYGNSQFNVPKEYEVGVFVVGVVTENNLAVEYAKIDSNVVNVSVCDIKSTIVKAY